MNRIIPTMIIILSMIQFSFAQSGETRGLKLTNRESFFEEFLKHKEQQKRGEFETKEEYERRISMSLDTSSTFYFELDRSEYSEKYKYDADAERLTIFGGEFALHNQDYQPHKDKAVTIHSRTEDKGSYQASNSFGATVTVDKFYNYYYVLNFINSDNIPDSIFNKTLAYFSLSIIKTPIEAKLLVNNLSLIIGVKLLDYQQSTYELVSRTKPELSDPLDICRYAYLIKVKFASLILYDKSSKNILAQFVLIK